LPGLRALVSVLVLVAAGCTSTPEATSEQDAVAKQFGTIKGSATLYMYRAGSDFDDHVGDSASVLYVDNRAIGSMMTGMYFVVHLSPGSHVLSGIATDQGRMTLQVQAGQLYFVSLQVTDGNTQYTLVNPDQGRREVSECCTLYDNFHPGRRPVF